MFKAYVQRFLTLIDSFFFVSYKKKMMALKMIFSFYYFLFFTFTFLFNCVFFYFPFEYWVFNDGTPPSATILVRLFVEFVSSAMYLLFICSCLLDFLLDSFCFRNFNNRKTMIQDLWYKQLLCTICCISMFVFVLLVGSAMHILFICSYLYLILISMVSPHK